MNLIKHFNPKKISISILVFSIILVSSIFVNAKTINEEPTKLLFVVQQNEDLVNIQTSNLTDSTYYYMVDFVSIANLSKKDLLGYKAVAIPYSEVKKLGKMLSKLYESGGTVFIYGNLTINNYKEALLLEKFGIVVPVKDPTEIINDKTAFQHFSNDQEKNDIVNVISLSKAGEGSLSYIEKSDNEIIEPYQFYKSIIDDFQKIYTQGIQPRSATIIRSEFNFKSYYDDSASCTWMDYTLYRNYDEQDPTYDYFALTSNVWGTTSGYQRHIGVIEARQYMAYSADEIIDNDPVTAYYCGSVNVSVDLTGGSVLSYNYNLTNIPNIYCNADYSSDNVYWSLTESWPLSFPIGSQVFKSSVSWASTGTYAAINVFFNSGVHLNDHSWSLLGSGRTINVIYDY